LEDPDPVHDVPVMLQVTADCAACEMVAVIESGRFSPAELVGSPAPVAATVMAAQLLTQGPLPPVAHPLANARLISAAANSSFFMIRFSLVNLPLAEIGLLSPVESTRQSLKPTPI
jgi:hypothetical protein